MKSFGDWALHVSRSTGRQYWFNVVTKKSAWYDARLPTGWGKMKDSETGPEYYISLVSGARRDDPPAPHEALQPPPPPLPAPGAPAAGAWAPTASAPVPVPVPALPVLDTCAPPPAKRPRLEEAAPAPLPPAAAAAPPAPAAPERGLRISNTSRAVFPDPSSLPPGLLSSDLPLDLSALPALPPVDFTSPFFGPEHRLLCDQITAHMKREALDELLRARAARKARLAELRRARLEAAAAEGLESEVSEGEAEAEADEEEEEDDAPSATVLDIGAGTGAATHYLLTALESPLTPAASEEGVEGSSTGEGGASKPASAAVTAATKTVLHPSLIAVDAWVPSYYTASLHEFSDNEAAAAAWEASTAAVDPYVQFSVNFADQPAVAAIRRPVGLGLRGVEDGLEKLLSAGGMKPSLIYLDGDLHGGVLERTLDYAYRCLYGTVKFGLRLPVADPSMPAKMLPLIPHFIGGGWDRSAEVRAAVTRFAAARGLKLYVEGGVAWTLSGQLITTATALRIENESIVARETRRAWIAGVKAVIDKGGGEGGGDLGALAAAIAPHPEWINQCDEGDKRHRNVLMHAAMKGATWAVTELIDTHGADVNAQADKSKYTALIDAAYGGHAGTVSALLARGASPHLVNKWGESALIAARSSRARGVREVLALLEPLGTGGA